MALLLDTAESLLEDNKQLGRLISLSAYFESYWQAIEALSHRGLSVSSGVGVCESGHRYDTNCMKRQGQNGLKQGAENMTTLLMALRNKDFKTRYRRSHPATNFSSEIGLSMRQLLKKAEHQPHMIPQAQMALNGPTSLPIERLKKWI